MSQLARGSDSMRVCVCVCVCLCQLQGKQCRLPLLLKEFVMASKASLNPVRNCLRSTSMSMLVRLCKESRSWLSVTSHAACSFRSWSMTSSHAQRSATPRFSCPYVTIRPCHGSRIRFAIFCTPFQNRCIDEQRSKMEGGRQGRPQGRRERGCERGGEVERGRERERERVRKRP